MVKTISIAALAQYRFVKLYTVYPMSEGRLLMVLFIILWAHPQRPSE